MKQHKIVLLSGDGIGPEISSVTKEILEKVSYKYNFKIHFVEKLFGGKAIDKFNKPLPDETLYECKNCDAVLLAAIGDPKYDNIERGLRPESGLLALRAGMSLFANIRPVKILPSLISASTLKPEIIKNVDLIVVRELTGGIYFGQPKGCIETESGKRAFNTMSYSTNEIERIARVAFKLAGERGKKVCSVDKANVLDVSQLWREKVSEVSNEFKDIELSNLYVDNAAMQLIRNPEQFDVILTGNLFGDIISDEAAMLTGSIGMLPSASLSTDGPGLFEPVHGSAPDIAGQNKANPIAMVLSAAMMLKITLKEKEAAAAIEEAVNNVLKHGFRTPDIMNESSIEVGCKEIGKELLKEFD